MDIKRSLLTGLAALVIASSSYPAVAAEKYHTVRKGETFSHIAKEYGVSIASLKEYNPGLNPKKISIGQQIKYHSTVSRDESSYTTQIKSPAKPGYFLPSQLKLSKKGESFLKREEGLKLETYDDVDKSAIGYGHDLLPEENFTSITLEKAEELFNKDVEKGRDAIVKNVKVPITQNEYDSLISFIHNVGPYGFERSSALKWLNKGNEQKAAERLLVWNTVKNKYNSKLAARREREKQLFLTKP